MTLPRGRFLGKSGAEPCPASAFGIARTAATAMRAAANDGVADERAIDRIVDLSRLLAERLLGRSLELDPPTIVALARGVVAEARSARSVRVFVHPSHVGVLESATRDFDPEGRVHSVSEDPELDPGDIRLETELGTVDARLGAELESLARHLREALRS